MLLNFGIKDFVDISLVALILYYLFKIMRKSRTLNVFFGVIVFILIWFIVSQIIEMKLLGTILNKLVSVGVLAILILFQDEIRKFLFSLGEHNSMKYIFKLFDSRRKTKLDKTTITPIVMACMNMAKTKTGALIVIERSIPLTDIIATGDKVDAFINQRLVENIFFKNSPLHDGAMVISTKRIKAAGCILPVSHNIDIPKELGLRHRAAMGITQESDAIAIVVSEETGRITAAIKGQFKLKLSGEELDIFLEKELSN